MGAHPNVLLVTLAVLALLSGASQAYTTCQSAITGAGSAPTVDIFWDYVAAGNIYTITQDDVCLVGFQQSIKPKANANFNSQAFVYRLEHPWTTVQTVPMRKVWDRFFSLASRGSVYYEDASPVPINVPLENGKQYFIGMTWQGQVADVFYNNYLTPESQCFGTVVTDWLSLGMHGEVPAWDNIVPMNFAKANIVGGIFGMQDIIVTTSEDICAGGCGGAEQGKCNCATAICDCKPGFSGPNCEVDACNTITCAGVSTCKHGQCVCDFADVSDDCYYDTRQCATFEVDVDVGTYSPVSKSYWHAYTALEEACVDQLSMWLGPQATCTGLEIFVLESTAATQLQGPFNKILSFEPPLVVNPGNYIAVPNIELDIVAGHHYIVGYAFQGTVRNRIGAQGAYPNFECWWSEQPTQAGTDQVQIDPLLDFHVKSTVNGPLVTNYDFHMGSVRMHAVIGAHSGCYNDCAGKGSCHCGLCTCNVGYTGPHCADCDAGYARDGTGDCVAHNAPTVGSFSLQLESSSLQVQLTYVLDTPAVAAPTFTIRTLPLINSKPLVVEQTAAAGGESIAANDDVLDPTGRIVLLRDETTLNGVGTLTYYATDEFGYVSEDGVITITIVSSNQVPQITVPAATQAYTRFDSQLTPPPASISIFDYEDTPDLLVNVSISSGVGTLQLDNPGGLAATLVDGTTGFTGEQWMAFQGNQSAVSDALTALLVEGSTSLTVQLFVNDSDASNAKTAVASFSVTIVPIPTLTGVVPLYAPAGPGVASTPIRLVGADLTEAASQVDLFQCVFGVLSSPVYLGTPGGGQLYCDTPVGAVANTVESLELYYDATLLTASGLSFNFYPQVTVDGLGKETARVSGNETLLVNGTNFLNNGLMACRVGSKDATDVVFLSSTQLTLSTPAQVFGTYAVTCSANGGYSYGPSSATVRYVSFFSDLCRAEGELSVMTEPREQAGQEYFPNVAPARANYSMTTVGLGGLSQVEDLNDEDRCCLAASETNGASCGVNWLHGTGVVDVVADFDNDVYANGVLIANLEPCDNEPTPGFDIHAWVGGAWQLITTHVTTQGINPCYVVPGDNGGVSLCFDFFTPVVSSRFKVSFDNADVEFGPGGGHVLEMQVHGISIVSPRTLVPALSDSTPVRAAVTTPLPYVEIATHNILGAILTAGVDQETGNVSATAWLGATQVPFDGGLWTVSVPYESSTAVANFTSLTLTAPVAGSYEIRFTSASVATMATVAITVVAGDATQLVLEEVPPLTQLPSAQFTPLGDFTLRTLDGGGNVADELGQPDRTITVSITGSAASLQGDTSLLMSGGVVSSTDLGLVAPLASAFTVHFSTPGLPDASLAMQVVAGVPHALVVTGSTSPLEATVQTAIPALTVTAYDAGGNVADANGDVIVASVNGSTVLLGTLTRAFGSGSSQVAFTGLTLVKPPAMTFEFTFTSATVPVGGTHQLTVVAGPAAYLVSLPEELNVTAAASAPVTAFQLVTMDISTVNRAVDTSIRLVNITSSSLTLGCGSSCAVYTTDGEVDVTTLTLVSPAPGVHVLEFTTEGLPTGRLDLRVVTGPPAYMTLSPAQVSYSSVVEVLLEPVTVTVRDTAGNAVLNTAPEVTITVAPLAGFDVELTAASTLEANTTFGAVTFSNVRLSQPQSNATHMLEFTSPGLALAVLPVEVVVGAPYQVGFEYLGVAPVEPVVLLTDTITPLPLLELFITDAGSSLVASTAGQYINGTVLSQDGLPPLNVSGQTGQQFSLQLDGSGRAQLLDLEVVAPVVGSYAVLFEGEAGVIPTFLNFSIVVGEVKTMQLSNSPNTTYPTLPIVTLESIELNLVDAAGQLSTAGGDRTVTVSNDGSTISFDPAAVLQETSVGGVVTFSNVKIQSPVAGVHTLRFQAAEIAADLVWEVTVLPGAPTVPSIASFSGASHYTLAATPIDPISIAVADAAGSPLQSGTVVSVSVVGATAALQGTLSVPLAGGLAVFGDLEFLAPSSTLSPHVLEFSVDSVGGLTVQQPITVAVGPPHQLAIESPASLLEGSSDGSVPIQTITVALLDAAGVLSNAATGVQVTASIPAGAASTLLGNLTVSSTFGRVIFNNLALETPGVATYPITFASTGLVNTSISQDVGPGAPFRLGVVPAASLGTFASEAVVTIPPFGVEVQDAAGLLQDADSSSRLVTISSSTLPLNGTTSVTTMAGVATVAGLELLEPLPQGTFALTFSTGGLVTAQGWVTIVPGSVVELKVVTAPGAPVPSSLSAALPLVEVGGGDRGGNVQPGVPAVGNVTVTLVAASGGGTPLGPLPVLTGTLTRGVGAEAAGVAQFGDLQLLLPRVGTYALAFTSDLGWAATSVEFDVTWGTPYALNILTHPPSTHSNFHDVTGADLSLLSRQPVVEVQDRAGNRVLSDYSTSVQATTVPFVGVEGLKFTTVTAAAGVVTYTKLALLGTRGQFYAFEFASLGLQSVSTGGNTTWVTACPANQRTDGTLCVCAPGYQYVPGGEPTNALKSCSACTTPFYKSEQGNTGCLPCGQNRQSKESGAQSLNECVCAPDYYSETADPLDVCLECPSEQAVCPGGTVILPRPGYWRNGETGEIYACPIPGACEGGTLSACAQGYSGPLCSTCIDGYGLIGGACRQCGSPLSNWLQLTGFFVLGLTLVISFVGFQLKSKETNHSTVTLKVLVNFLQIMALIGQMDIRNWPTGVIPTFLRRLLSVFELALFDVRFVSLDCTLGLTYYQTFLGYIIVTAVIVMSPLIVVSLSKFLNLVSRPTALHVPGDYVDGDDHAHFNESVSVSDIPSKTTAADADDDEYEERVTPEPSPAVSPRPGPPTETTPPPVPRKMQRKGSMASLGARVKSSVALTTEQRQVAKSGLITSIIVLVFLSHTTITKRMLELFDCREVDGVRVLTADLTLRCDTSEHRFWQVIAAIIALVYCLGVPLAGAMALYRNRKKLHDPKVQRRYLFLYNGYNDNAYYYEMVILIRKILFVSVVVFMRGETFLQTTSAQWLLMAAIVAHVGLRPFKLDIAQVLEGLALLELYLMLNMAHLFANGQLVEGTFVAGVFILGVTFLLFVVVALAVVVATMKQVSKAAPLVRSASQSIGRRLSHHNLGRESVTMRRSPGDGSSPGGSISRGTRHGFFDRAALANPTPSSSGNVTLAVPVVARGGRRPSAGSGSVSPQPPAAEGDHGVVELAALALTASQSASDLAAQDNVFAATPSEAHNFTPEEPQDEEGRGEPAVSE